MSCKIGKGIRLRLKTFIENLVDINSSVENIKGNFKPSPRQSLYLRNSSSINHGIIMNVLVFKNEEIRLKRSGNLIQTKEV